MGLGAGSMALGAGLMIDDDLCNYPVNMCRTDGSVSGLMGLCAGLCVCVQAQYDDMCNQWGDVQCRRGCV